MTVNEGRTRLVTQCLLKVFDSLKGLQVTLLGLTYKSGTSTLRRSIALEIIRDLNGQGVCVRAFDPLVQLGEQSDLPVFELYEDPYEAARGSDAVVLLTEWTGFGDLKLRKLREEMRSPVFFDTRNLCDPSRMRKEGFTYFGIGRNVLKSELQPARSEEGVQRETQR